MTPQLQVFKDIRGTWGIEVRRFRIIVSVISCWKYLNPVDQMSLDEHLVRPTGKNIWRVDTGYNIAASKHFLNTWRNIWIANLIERPEFGALQALQSKYSTHQIALRLFNLNEMGLKILEFCHWTRPFVDSMQGASSPTQGPIPELAPYIEVILQRLRHEGGKETVTAWLCMSKGKMVEFRKDSFYSQKLMVKLEIDSEDHGRTKSSNRNHIKALGSLGKLF